MADEHWIPWWRFLARKRCTHPRQRCIHGDEIIFGAGGNRAWCLVCGKPLPDLPVMCNVTGQPHSSKGAI